jgi:hypothetical protein
MPNIFNKGCLGSCSGCILPYELYVKNSKVYSNITADRIDNNICHRIDNIKLLCDKCNSAKSDK